MKKQWGLGWANVMINEKFIETVNCTCSSAKSKTKKTKYKEEQIKNKERKNLFPY